ncbi:HlyD family efflux transporter periplasmic adaptor subunit [Candidatus Parcubacteria bacterium]|nr:HlyD family efflux transporter periplasmic adaptor subunit [Candidatus Parcubacteria bacterium]
MPIKKMLKSKVRFLLGLVKKHKVISTLVLVGLCFGGYFLVKGLFSGQAQAQYVTAEVERGNLVVSLSASGQVLAKNQVEIKAKEQGEIISVKIKANQEVKKGDLLFQIDLTTAQKNLKNAQINLETMQLEFEELLGSPDELDLLKAQNSLTQQEQNIQKSKDNIEKSYEDIFNDVADVFLNLPSVMTDFRDTLYSEEIAKKEKLTTSENITTLYNTLLYSDYTSKDYLEVLSLKTESSYALSKEKFNLAFNNYKNTSRSSGKQEKEDLLALNIEAARLISDGLKDSANLFDYWVDQRTAKGLNVFSTVASYQTSLKANISKVNGFLSSLLSAQSSLQSNKDQLINQESSLEEAKISFERLKEGATDLEIRTKKLALDQKQDNLLTAKEALNNTSIRAPYAGVILQVNTSLGDEAGSGVMALLSTKEKIISISLNEIDIVKVKEGQKATILFDAINGLTYAGEVVEVSGAGTISGGVVSYEVKVALLNQDEKIKEGMSALVSIITDFKQNVLLVPNSALKTQGGIQYVEMPGTGGSGPTTKQVETGISNETKTEIISGLSDSDIIISQTISTAAAANQTQGSGFSSGGMPQGGNVMRIIR